MRATAGNYEIDDDPVRIDPGAAVAFLTTQAYWARWRGPEEIKEQIGQAWRVVGGYDRAGAMVGFARAVSDGRPPTWPTCTSCRNTAAPAWAGKSCGR